MTKQDLVLKVAQCVDISIQRKIEIIKSLDGYLKYVNNYDALLNFILYFETNPVYCSTVKLNILPLAFTFNLLSSNSILCTRKPMDLWGVPKIIPAGNNLDIIFVDSLTEREIVWFDPFINKMSVGNNLDGYEIVKFEG